MFIKSVKATNFRGLKEARFMFGEHPFVLLAAPNGVGKTSVIDAIEWCLTGSIGRLKSSFDARSTNSSERKINVDGILKHKDADSKDRVKVEVCVKDGEREYRITRSQKKDELGWNGRDLELFVNGEPHTDGDWLSRCIDRNFYNFHFCDIQKSITIQNEKRSDLSEKFAEYISDYSAQLEVAENLKLFQRDADLRAEKMKGKRSIAEAKLGEIEEAIKRLAETVGFIEYPAALMYQGEVTDLRGKEREFLLEQQKALRACGYWKVSEDLKERIADRKIRELCSKLGQLQQFLSDKKEAVAEAVRVGLHQSSDCIFQKEEKIEEYRAIPVNQWAIFETGPKLIAIEDVRFSEAFFLERKEQIQGIDIQIQELEDVIETLSGGNEIIQALTAMIDQKHALSQYHDLRMQAEGRVKCPVCGSERFGELETENILEEAAVYLASSEASLHQKTEEKNRKKKQRTEWMEELLRAGRAVLEDAIRKETEEKKKLEQLDRNTRDFFALQESCAEELQNTNEIIWWCDPDNLDILRTAQQKKLMSEEEAVRRKQEAEELLSLLSFQRELQDSEEAVCQKISAQAAAAPKLIEFSKELLIGKLNALSCQIQSQEAMESSKKLRDCQAEIERLDSEIRQVEQVKEWAARHEAEIRSLIQEMIREEYDSVGPNLYSFYKKLTRINTIQSIQLMPDETEQLVSLMNENGKHIVNILSNGQLSVFILAYFFAGIVSRGNGEAFRVYFIDDLTSCMDDVNMLSFLDLLKYLLKDSRNPIDQLFFATCDDRIEKLLCYKMEGSGIPYTKLAEANFPKH